MSAANSSIPWRARRAWVALALVAAAGITAGWFLGPSQALTFDHVYALLDPACMAALCVGLLVRPSKHTLWLVPLLLTLAMLSVAGRTQVPVVTATGLAAGVLAILACLRGHNRSAIAGTLICCAAIAATLLGGSVGQDSY